MNVRNVHYLLSKYKVPWDSFKQIKSCSSNSNVDDGSDDLPSHLPKYEKCINDVKLMGRVERSPLISKKAEKPFLSFTLITSTFPKDGLLQAGKFEYHHIFTFNPAVIKDLVTFVKAGDRLYVNGKLTGYKNFKTDKWVAGVLLINFICLS